MDGQRVVLLTGASRGLGLAMTRQLIERGHVVWGCARSVEAVNRLADEFPGPHRFHAVDVADERAVAGWAGGLLTGDDVPDLVLNNAAVINRNAPLWHVPAAEFAQVIDVGIKGVFYVIRHFLPPMLTRGTGVVVNFSSGWGRSSAPEVAPYCAAKWAVEGMTRALAAELPRGMAAIPLNPGVIHTDMLESCFGTNASAYPSADQWARRAVPFLLGLSGRHNGQPLTVPG